MAERHIGLVGDGAIYTHPVPEGSERGHSLLSLAEFCHTLLEHGAVLEIGHQ